jgi:para-aminobenzoate synthetase / 4-amino-4-deoxychorismate lyase
LIETNEVLLKNEESWLHFSKPYKIFTTTDLRATKEMLVEVERLVNENGWHAAGLLSYEAAPAFDPALHVLSSGDFPLLWFGLYPTPQQINLPALTPNLDAIHWQSTVERQSYNTSIEKIKEYIAQGRTYQVNYTMRLQARFSADPWIFFLGLAQNQNKYAAYLNTGRYTICSASPELFFQLNGESIRSRPMKGTVKRGRTTAEDQQQMEWLRSSGKNRAENVMIVDMIRNDLGRIAQIGSVHVPQLFHIEKYPTLFQMTSTVEARTQASITEIVTGLFPCASITGAPKVSTMKIISELETTPRKLYTGSIGFISPHRKAQFNVAIRTAIIDNEARSAEYGVGGGIVWDSTNTDEYREAVLKSHVLTQPQEDFSLLETILWTPQEGYFLREKHIARMADSARYFDFGFSEKELKSLLDETQKQFNAPQRLRILLDRSGRLTCETQAYIEQKKVFNVELAKSPINSSDVFFFHKTTNRKMYPSIQGRDDVLMFNEKEELTEFTIGNLIVRLDGKLYTPPVSSGLLAGTFRTHLLETDQVKERVIHKSELNTFEKIYLANSVRKWVEVEI